MRPLGLTLTLWLPTPARAGVAHKPRTDRRQARVDEHRRVVGGEITTVKLAREIPESLGTQRRELGPSWAQEGLREPVVAASIAGVAQGSVSLVASPGQNHAHQAVIADGPEHAWNRLVLASRNAGVPLHPAALPMSPNFGTVSHLRAGDPAAIAIAVFEQGCINESEATADAGVAAYAGRSPRAELALWFGGAWIRHSTTDEVRHAMLAWPTSRCLFDEFLERGYRRPVASARARRPRPTLLINVLMNVPLSARSREMSTP